MLSIAALTGGPDYYLELTSINYYTLGGEPLPLFAGTVAKEMGLPLIAEKEQVYKLCAGFDPETGERLVRNAGKPKRNPGHDLTFSCPKTVSLVWALGDDKMRKDIEKAQLSAVLQALAYLEDKAGFSRVGTDGQRLVKCPLLFALFEHGTSRAMDPQLHTHALLINLTMHSDGRTTALDTTYLYHFKMACGAIYRAALAMEIKKLGWEVVQRQLGASLGFEIEGIPKQLVEEFSKRRAEIEETLKLRAGSLDAANSKYAELIAKETRRTKSTEKPRATLIGEWQEIGRAFGVDVAYLLRLLMPHRPLAPEERSRRKEGIFQEAISALSEQHAHWNEVELTKAVAERAAGRISARDVRELIEHKLRSPAELIAKGTLQTEQKNHAFKRYIDRSELRFTTPQVLQLERKLIEGIEKIVRGARSESPERLVEAAIRSSSRGGKPLDSEQAEAVRYLTSGPSVRLLSGLAGTGKTHTLSVCHALWKVEGREVIGCAVAGAAAKRLQQGTGIPSDTLERTLWNLDHGRMTLKPNSILLVDESGMMGTKHLVRLVEHVKEAEGVRLLLVGDAKQLQPISAGGPHKYLAREEILGEFRLENIRRQKEVWARDAVKLLEQGKSGEAVTSFIEHGRFHLADTRTEAIGRLIEQWKADGGIKDPARVFLLASLNVEVKEINLRAQAARILAGEVDPERKLFANGVNFHVGDRLQFQKRSKPLGFENSDCGIVTGVDPERQRISVRLDEGDREITVDLKRYSGGNLRLGYASTTHKAQGASIPHVHVLMGGTLTDLHMAYVQASRSQLSTHLFCDKHTAGGPGLADLIRSLAHLRQKTMAQEIEGHEPELKPQRGVFLGM